MVDIVTNAGDGTITGSGGAAIDMSGTSTNITDLLGADGVEGGLPGDSIAITSGSGHTSSGDGGAIILTTGDGVTRTILIGGSVQDETDYDGVGSNGIFVGGDGVGGTAYVAADTITLSDGSLITVDVVDGDGDVTDFTVTTSGGTTVTAGVTLTQSSTSGTGTAFTLTPELANITDFGNTGGTITLDVGISNSPSALPGSILLSTDGVPTCETFCVTVTTTDATPIEVLAFPIASGETLAYEIWVTAREDATGDSFSEKVFGAGQNTGGTTADVGVPGPIVRVEDAGATAWTIAATADDTADAVLVDITGEAAHTIDWKVKVTVMKV